MAARVKTTIAMLSVTMLFVWHQVEAQDALIGIDGCSVLGALVYYEVAVYEGHQQEDHAESFFFSRRSMPIVCRSTARTVTRAFSISMRQLKIDVSWGEPGNADLNFCDSVAIELCFPIARNKDWASSNTESELVARYWRAVLLALSPSLGPGSWADVSQFGLREMQLTLRQNLWFETRAAR